MASDNQNSEHLRLILNNLSIELNKFIKILRLDPKCQWTSAFDSYLIETQLLMKSNVTTNEVNDLAYQIMSVYQGTMGSFNDYSPYIYHPESGRYNQIPGTEEFEALSNQIYSSALLLRTIN